MDIIEIGGLELAFSSGFILLSGGLALWLRLGLTRPLIIGTARTYLQLIALGLVLRWIFRIDQAWMVLAILFLMMLMAVFTILSRLKTRGPRLMMGVFGGLFLSGVVVTFAVMGLVIRPEPWYQPRYFLPIAGMVIGNSMNAIALTQERLFEGFQERRAEIMLRLSLGATAWEASLPLIQTAFRAGMIPTLNSMATVGIVFIPGMMTGQVLAGIDPITAAGYQIVVILMISGANALGAIISLTITFRQAFDSGQRLIE